MKIVKSIEGTINNFIVIGVLLVLALFFSIPMIPALVVGFMFWVVTRL